MIEPSPEDPPLYCPQCGGPCDVEADEIRGRLAVWTEFFVFCGTCPFVSELGPEGLLLDVRGNLRLDMLQEPGAAFGNPDDFIVRRPVPVRLAS